VIENLIDQTPEAMVIYNGQDTIRPIVQFIGSDVSREVGQGFVQVVIRDLFGGLFSPPLPPSFEG
jgi:hypothetical protein